MCTNIGKPKYLQNFLERRGKQWFIGAKKEAMEITHQYHTLFLEEAKVEVEELEKKFIGKRGNNSM